MLQKDKHKIACEKFVDIQEELDDNCKSYIKKWINHCYNLNKPQTRKDIENLIRKAYESTNEVNKLIPNVLEKAIQKGLYSNVFLDWKVKYAI